MIIKVAHIKDGFEEYDDQTFKESINDLVKNLEFYHDKGLQINNGDVIDSDTTENFYRIKYKQFSIHMNEPVLIYWVYDLSDDEY